jgi:hypothetical protein
MLFHYYLSSVGPDSNSPPRKKNYLSQNGAYPISAEKGHSMISEGAAPKVAAPSVIEDRARKD